MKSGIKGFDLSSHDNVTADMMRKAKESGYSFVILRASCGLSLDRRFEQHYAAAREAGLYIGAYAYYVYADETMSTQETATFLSAVQGKTFDLPLFIDFENRGAYSKGNHLGMLSAKYITKRANAAISSICAAGFNAGIYCDADWASTKMYMKELPNSCIVWIADWTDPFNYKGRCEFRQYSGNVTIPGIGGGIDADRLLVDLYEKPVTGGAFGVIVNCTTFCNRRAEPTTRSKTVGKAYLGENIFVNGKRDVKGVRWYHDSIGNWIHSRFVQIDDSKVPIM